MSESLNKFLDANLQFAIAVSSEISPEEYARQVKVLLATVKKTSNSVLQVPGKDKKDNIKDILKPEIHSIAWQHILLARAKDSPDRPLWDSIGEFLEVFDARQVGHDLETFKKLVSIYVEAAQDKPIVTIRSLRIAVLRLAAAFPHTLTSIHTIFVRECLRAQTYRTALKVISQDIREIPSLGTDDMKTPEVLRYFLYSGMIYLGLKLWEKAMFQFTVCLLPTSSQGNVSKLQLEAYKKYILAGLLHSGSVPPTPKLIFGRSAKTIQKLSRAYELFAHLYEVGDIEAILKEFDVIIPIFRRDSNAGLAMQALASFRKFRVIAFKDSYATLSMDSLVAKGEKFAVDKALGRKSGPLKEEIEKSILTAIKSGELSAKLSHTSDGACIVRFLESSEPTQETESANLALLMSTITHTKELTNFARDTSRKMGLDKNYILQSNKLARTGGGSSGMYGPGGSFIRDGGDPMEDVFYVEAEELDDNDF